jgi:hypothetical protein
MIRSRRIGENNQNSRFKNAKHPLTTTTTIKTLTAISALVIAPPHGSFLFLRRLQHLAGLGVDKMYSRASGTRHGFVNLAICSVIGSNPALYLQTSLWAAVGEGDDHARDMGTAPLDGLADFRQYIVWLGQLYARDGRGGSLKMRACHIRRR